MKKGLLLFIFGILSGSTLWAQQDNSFTEKTIVVHNSGCDIQGTLLSGNDKSKVAIIIAGSGPTDRDGNSPVGVTSDSYKILAEDLAKAGIATYRYDKRGIAKSSMKDFDEAKLTFNDYIIDAEKIFDYMKDSLAFKNIYFIGHSEGSLIGMIASERKRVKGYVSLSGSGRRIDSVLLEQLTTKVPPAIMKQIDSMFYKLAGGQKIDSVPPYLLTLFRPSIQPYMISWIKYNPYIEIGKLTCPILVVQGACDIQIKTKDAELLHNGNKSSILDIIPQMTHMLKDADKDCNDPGMKTYKDKSLPINTKLTVDIISFIQKT